MKNIQEDNIRITRMQPDDIDEVLWVEQSSFRDPWSRALFEEEFKHPELSRFFIASSQKHIVGYMGFWLIQEEAHITNLAVHPAFRRRKIAELLLKETMRIADQLGVCRSTLEVRAGNEAAKRLYEKYNFKVVAIRRGYYTDNNEDALIMWNDDLSRFRGLDKNPEICESP